jgi:hypothetical protein
MSANKLSSSELPAKQAARLATLAIVGIGYFLVAVVTLHFLRPDYNPISRAVSQYAVGPYGFLMTSAFFSLSLGSLALVIGLFHGVSETGRSWIGLVLLGIWGVGIFIAGIFSTDLNGAPQTNSGQIHVMASVFSFFSLILAALLLSWRFKNDEKWSSFHRPALMFALLMLLAFVGLFVYINTGFGGLSQRIFIVAFLLWLLPTAARLRYVASRSLLK